MGAEEAKGAIHPTLFIGLGGTGKEILFRLRRRFYERWGVVGLPCLSYLWMDTDSRDVLAQGEKIDEIDLQLKFQEQEKIPLLKGTVGQDLGGILRDQRRNAYIHQWLPREVQQYGVEIGNGAGAVRSIGRLTFFAKYGEIRDRVVRAMERVTDRPQIEETKRFLPGVEFDQAPQAYLIFSVAGGTGGGTFLDMAFLLRDLKMPSITGIMLLPNVYYPTAFDEMAVRSYGNAYSALKELEFFTRRAKIASARGDSSPQSIDFEVNWNNQGQESIQGPPFSVLYLAEMRNEQSIGAGDRTELFHTLADSIFQDFLPGPFSSQKRSRMSDIFGYLSSHQDDDVPVAGTTLRQVYSRRYATFGMSKIEVPAETIREACACRLAAEIAAYWDRPVQNPDLKGTLQRDIRGRFDVDAVEGYFGSDWKRSIETSVANELADMQEGIPAAQVQEYIAGLPGKLEALQRNLVEAAGYDSRQWGQVISMIRNQTGTVQKEMRKRLEVWIGECLERPELGLNAMLGEGGLVSLLRFEFQHEYKDSPSQSAQRAEQRREEAAIRKQRCDTLINELHYAAHSFWLGLLGLRNWTLRKLQVQLRDEVEQYLKAIAAACVAEQCASVVEEGDRLLAERNVDLETFKEAVKVIHAHFDELTRNHLAKEHTFLTISVFDPEEDMQKFYALDFDEKAGRHLPVSAKEEHRKFTGQSLGAGQTMLDLVDLIKTEGHDKFGERLHGYANDRFRNDFATCRKEKERHRHCGRFVEVLELLESRHKDELQDIYRRFVSSALPMLRRSMRISGDNAKEVKKVYLGLPYRGREPYTSFERRVRDLLVAQNYPDPAPFVTDDPTCIQMFVESYAFPLSSVDLVVGDCHNSYYRFYRELRRSTRVERLKIPLHLRADWEGEFEDLKPLEEKVAPRIYDALQILCLGPVLGVLKVIPREQQREFAYRQWVPPAAIQEELGNKREAVETLQSNNSVRDDLMRHLRRREAALVSLFHDGDQTLVDYYWILAYLRLAVLPPSTPEYAIVVDKLVQLGNTIADKGIQLDDLTPLPQPQRIEACKAKLANVEWTDGYPALRMKPLILGREDEEFAKAV